ncbi:hypothetical protein G7070_07055 [Propioniciclava coleopterorum]|uniref:Uncharacterized protein n=1 Tax=Propioniciclava coleopterorum TaxID=2714937 RepID=A0A6G7Y5S8_9ACTN|nr:hypothetical protein [Propioniciclava coleopterorum]QIK72069.1 hypothetical protein G7070_07055 [Propioniciclava coleopterorum]
MCWWALQAFEGKEGDLPSQLAQLGWYLLALILTLPRFAICSWYVSSKRARTYLTEDAVLVVAATARDWQIGEHVARKRERGRERPCAAWSSDP